MLLGFKFLFLRFYLFHFVFSDTQESIKHRMVRINTEETNEESQQETGVYFLNQFAIKVAKRLDSVKEIAEKYGFVNHGQEEKDMALKVLKNMELAELIKDYVFSFEHKNCASYFTGLTVYDLYYREVFQYVTACQDLASIGGLEGYYLLSHEGIEKRSLNASSRLYRNLKNEPKVMWVMQQKEIYRTKRDVTIPQPPMRHRRKNRTPIVMNFPDPLFKEQWYLNGAVMDGVDMNVALTWQHGYTGKGVVVTILDDGIQYNHPDLAQNYDPTASFDINDNDTDPTPQDNGDNKHGTRCAGEVAAVAFNKYCGVGISYNARVGGVRMLDGTVNDVVEAKALSLNSKHIDIYSASWGPEDDGKTVDGPGPLAKRAFHQGIKNGRNGKGSIYVWASGNGGKHSDSCNCDGYTNSIFTLSISSTTQSGLKPWYLEECSSTLASTYSSGTPGHDKSVATVDMDLRLRPDFLCTLDHTGTSASAPLAAGIIALALEANPNLTWRDTQYLVIISSRSGPLEKESGWIINGVKRKISHKFGYGLMDALEMVKLAEQWTSVPPQHICKSQNINEDKPIEMSYGYTLSVHMDVNGCSGTMHEVQYLEHVQCKISLSFYPRGNLRILLTSPMGTTSTLLTERPLDTISSNFDEWPFLSVHFWGEKAEGRWNLQVINAGNNKVQQRGILKKWQLIFYGTAIDPVKLHPKNIVSHHFLPNVTESNKLLIQEISHQNNDVRKYSLIDDIDVENIEEHDERNIPSAQRENVLADANDKLVQHICDPECDLQGCYGEGPTQCVACKQYRLDNSCVSRCPPRSFANQGGVCWPCHETCETCAGPGQDSCLTCAPAHLLIIDLAVCVQQCPDGYFEDNEATMCLPCKEHCATCSEAADKCITCEHQLVLHEESCLSACPLNTFKSEDNKCVSCHLSCETCNGSNENECVSCPNPYFYFERRCISSCPFGFYADQRRKECIRCPLGCIECNATRCLTCGTGWTMSLKHVCYPIRDKKCDANEYDDDGHCRRCHSTCESCIGVTSNNCLTCELPLLLEDSSCVPKCSKSYFQMKNKCERCSKQCAECDSLFHCTACANGSVIQSNACLTECSAGYYEEHANCIKCYVTCQTCSGPRRNQCVTCPDGWLMAAGECHPECPQGFSLTKYGCHKCHHYCAECKGMGPTECTSCPQHFMLSGGLCIECLSSQYYIAESQRCHSCHASCKSCSGPGPFSCVTCAHPLHLELMTNQCLPCCPERLDPNINNTILSECCHCHRERGSCLNKRPDTPTITVNKLESIVNGSKELHNEPKFIAVIIAVSICAVVLVASITHLILRKRNLRRKRLSAAYSRLASYDDERNNLTRKVNKCNNKFNAIT